jgi:hypothetical protein
MLNIDLDVDPIVHAIKDGKRDNVSKSRGPTAIVIVPPCTLNHACAIVNCNCCCARCWATVPVPTCQCLRLASVPLFHNQRHPGCQHRFRHLPIDGAALLVLLPPLLAAHSG